MNSSTAMFHQSFRIQQNPNVPWDPPCTFQITQNNTAFQNTLKNSGATSTAINVTGGVQNLVKGTLKVEKPSLISKTNRIQHPNKGRVSSLTPTRMNDLDRSL